MSNFRKGLLAIVLLGALLIGGYYAYQAYQRSIKPIVDETGIVQLPTGGTADNLIDSLYRQGLVTDTLHLRKAVSSYDYTYRPGQFEVQQGWPAKQLLRHLQIGNQKESKVVLTNGRLLGDFAQKATRFVEIDSAALHEALLDPEWLESKGLDTNTVISIAVPNTYFVYWDTTPEALRDRLYKEYERFWDKDNRLAKADSLGMTQQEVYTLASIVNSETNFHSEKPRIAGVYLNRLKRGMKLEADPTVVFSIGDFTLRRVLYKHLEHDSPYNTYMYTGLPPGPIAMADIKSIDAVLNPEEHDYLFFVAKGDGSGAHTFAKNMRGHSKNIRTFQRNLRKRNIRR